MGVADALEPLGRKIAERRDLEQVGARGVGLDMLLADAESDDGGPEAAAHGFRSTRTAFASACSASSVARSNGLCHGGLGAVEHVGDELGAIGEGRLAAVDALRALLVDEQTMVDAGCRRCRHISELDVAVRAEDRESAIAPGAEALRRIPVDADISRPAIAAQHHLAEILELGFPGLA